MANNQIPIIEVHDIVEEEHQDNYNAETQLSDDGIKIIEDSTTHSKDELYNLEIDCSEYLSKENKIIVKKFELTKKK